MILIINRKTTIYPPTIEAALTRTIKGGKVMGFQTTGNASEYYAADASKVTPLPGSMTYEYSESAEWRRRKRRKKRGIKNILDIFRKI